MMKATVMTAFGGAEVFKVTDIPKPDTVGPHQLLIKVICTSVNPVDFKMRSANWWGGTLPAVLGFDVSGVVELVGSACRRIKAGDHVFYSAELFGSNGANAEYHVVSENIVMPKPANVSWEIAAALPLAACTAYEAIIMKMGVKIGEKVLIHAGAGGVGSAAIQIAHAAGAFVITTASAGNHDFVKELGADVVIDYKTQDFVEATLKVTGGEGVDATFDTVGGETIASSTKCTKKFGRLATITNVDSIGSLIFRNQALYGVFFEREFEKIRGVADLAARELLTAHVHVTMEGLEQVAAAHTMLEKGGIKGKIVIRVAPNP